MKLGWNRKAKIGIFEIFVLIFSVVAFSYLVSGAEGGSAASPECEELCTEIVAIDSEQVSSLDIIRMIDKMQAEQPAAPVCLTDLAGEGVVEKCGENLDALKKLDDELLLKGLKEDPSLLSGDKVFGEMSERMSDPEFLEELKKPENNDVAKGWLNQINGISVQGKAPPIDSYNEKTGKLGLGGKSEGWSRTIDTKSFEGKMDMKIYENGNIDFGDGTKVTGAGDVSAKYEKGGWFGKDKLVIDAKTGANVDISSSDLSKSSISVKSDGGNVIRSGKTFSGKFNGEFTLKDSKFTGFRAGMNVKSNGHNYFVKGDRLDIRDGVIDLRSDLALNKQNPFKEPASLTTDTSTISGKRLVVFEDGVSMNEPWKDVANFQLDSNGNVVDVVMQGQAGKAGVNYNGLMSEDGGFNTFWEAESLNPVGDLKFPNSINVDTSTMWGSDCPFGVCGQNGLTFSANGQSVVVQSNSVLGGENIGGVFSEGNTLTTSFDTGRVHESIIGSGGKVHNVVVATGGAKNVGSSVSGKSSSIFSGFSTKTLTSVLTIGGLVAAAGGIYYLVSKDDDDGGDKKNDKGMTVQDTKEEEESCLDGGTECPIRKAGMDLGDKIVENID